MVKKSKNNGSPRQFTVRFTKDVEKTLDQMKEQLDLKTDSGLLEHIVTIFLAERRLISPEWKRG
jgi:hypothetical protein